jgi:AdoMet-dependent heme synthase
MKKAIQYPTSGEEFYFQWHLTERCNLKCLHCYQNNDTLSEIPRKDLLGIVDKMDEALTKWGKRGTLSLTGGEPFLRRDDLYELMGRLDSSSCVAYYDILSNGSFITEGEAKNLASHSGLRRVQVSLEGASAERNDQIRGKGSYDNTLQAIRSLKAEDIDISVMMTITRQNRDQIRPMIELLKQEEVPTIALERLIPEGRGADLSNLLLSPEELHEVCADIYHLAVNNGAVRILMHRPLFGLVAPDDPTVGALCSAGNNALTIMPDGTVYPCRRLPIPIGNVLTDGFYKIWYGSDVLWRLRNQKELNHKCQECEYLTNCRGCRAMAYATSGDFMGEDPQCWH